MQIAEEGEPRRGEGASEHMLTRDGKLGRKGFVCLFVCEIDLTSV